MAGTDGPPGRDALRHPATFDGHNDTLLRMLKARHRGQQPTLAGGWPGGHVDVPRARAGNFAGGFFACFVPATLDAAPEPEPVVEDGAVSFPLAEAVDERWALDATLRMVAMLLELERAGTVRVVRDSASLQSCVDRGPLAAILHLEGAEAIGDDLARLDVLHAAGLRSLGLVWSRPNRFACGVPFRFPHSPDTGPGLTEAGRALVRRANELRIMLDLSHLNEKGFWEVAELTTAPLVVTHTAAHALTASTRNLTDAQIDAVGAGDGLIGVNLAVHDLRADYADDADTPVARWADHVEHIAARIGRERVALGSDFDGATVPADVGDCAGIGVLLDELEARGWSEHERRGFAHRNWIRVLRRTWETLPSDTPPDRSTNT